MPEDKAEYIRRCLVEVIGEGRVPAEAQQICEQKWRQEHGGSGAPPTAPPAIGGGSSAA